MADIPAINRFLQDKLARTGRGCVATVEAAEWLDRAGLLKDSPTRPGLPLRRLLRAGRMDGQRQESNERWFIDSVVADRMKSDPTATHPEALSDDSATTCQERQCSHAADVLGDILTAGLRVVFVGTAVGNISARRGHYYSDPRNAFYRELHAAKLTPRVLLPEKDATLPRYGIGLTDVVKDQHTGDDAALHHVSLRAGAANLRRKLQDFRPAWVCFNGKTAYEVFSERPATYGKASAAVVGCLVFVVPSTSGRVNATRVFDGKTRTECFCELAARIADA